MENNDNYSSLLEEENMIFEKAGEIARSYDKSYESSKEKMIKKETNTKPNTADED